MIALRGSGSASALLLAGLFVAACSRSAPGDAQSASSTPSVGAPSGGASAGSGAAGTAPGVVDAGPPARPAGPQAPPVARDASIPNAPAPTADAGPIDAGRAMQDANMTGEDSGTADAGCSGPSCPRRPDCLMKRCPDDGPCQLVPEDGRCAQFEGPCVRGRCDAMLGCVAVVDPACDCDDGNRCTDDRLVLDHALAPNESACVHAPVSCAADGIACTVDHCDPATGCGHVPDSAQCEDASPCTTSRCDAALGCVTDPLADGSPCGEPSCGQQPVCRAGACVAEGALDPDCNVWFTPGDPGMLPWHVAACGSNVGDGLLPGAYNAQGSYSIQFAQLFASGEQLLFAPSYYPWRARLFDGSDWSAPGALAAVPAEIGGS